MVLTYAWKVERIDKIFTELLLMNVMKYDSGNRYAKTVLNIHALLQSCLYLEMKERYRNF